MNNNIRESVFVFVCLAALPVLSAGFSVYNIVPCIYGEERELAAEMAEYHRLTGEDTVLYSLPCAPEGKPATQKVDGHVASYRAFATACREADPGLKVGILIQSLLGHFVGDAVVRDREDWQRSVTSDGMAYRWCPLDPSFRVYVKETARRLAAERPCFVLTDDDVRDINGECFCPLHAAELNRRTGRSRTPDEWRTAVLASKPGDADYEAYFKLQRETLTGVNALVRDGLDAVDPTIPAGVCMGGEEYRFAGDHARTIAAKGQRPVMRISNSLYLEHQRGEYPFQEIVTRTQAYAALYADQDITLLDEADTWPQNLWSKSAESFFAHVVMGRMCGLEGAKIWCVNAHRKGEGPVSRAYTKVMAERKGYWASLDAAMRDSVPYGVIAPTIVKSSEWHAAKPTTLADNFIRPSGTWAEKVLTHFGVPCTASAQFERDGIWELAGAKTVARLTDEELKQLLSHRILIDGAAALALVKRGFTDLIGADVSAESPAVNCERWADDDTSAGRLVRNDKPPTYALRAGAKALTHLCFRAPDGTVTRVSPGTVLFCNPLGGVTCLTSYSGDGIFYNRYNEARKRWLVRVLEALNGCPFELTVMNDQEVTALARMAKDRRSAVVAAFNPGHDRFHDFRLLLARRPEKVEVLQPDGTWLGATFDYDRQTGVLLLPSETPSQGVYVLRVTFGVPKPVPVVSGTDSDWIDAAIAKVVADGSRTATIPRKADGSPWYVTRAILLPDDFTLVIDDCTVQLAPNVQDNIIRNAGAVDTGRFTPNRNITIRGRGHAVLCGGLGNHYEPNRSGDCNGWTTIGILFSHVTGFTVENVVLRETQAFGMSFEYCADGRIADIRLEDTNLMFNQDGIDLREGCHDIVIENVSGVCGDDAIALTGLGPSAKTLAVQNNWKGSGKPRRGMSLGREPGIMYVRPEDAIHHVTIRNVRAHSAGGHSVIRLLPQDGVEMHHITVSNVVDTTKANEVRAAGTIRIGDFNYWSIRLAQPGDLHDITIEDVEAKGKVGVWIKCPISDSTLRNIRVPRGTRKYDLYAPLIHTTAE